MLTEGQQNYLNKLSPERTSSSVEVRPFDPKTQDIARIVMKRVKSRLPDADVRFMGASALGISGQNDIDIYILTPIQTRQGCLEALEPIFGPITKNKWKWDQDKYEVSVYISDPSEPKFQEQLKIFEIFKTKPEILKQYELLKEANSGKSYQEYQIAKYEFYNKVLGIH